MILDLNIPRVSGHDILRRLEVEGRPPVVVFRGSMHPDDKAASLAHGAKDYVVKPAHVDEFVQAVQQILERFSPSIH